MKIARTFYFANGNVAVVDPQGQQVPEFQGRWEDVWRKVWDAADEDTVFEGWPSMTGARVAQLKRDLPERLWPTYFAVLGARSKGLILAATEAVEQHFPGDKAEFTPQKLRAATDMLKNLATFHDEAADLGMTGGEIMLEWEEICRQLVECSEKAMEEP